MEALLIELQETLAHQSVEIAHLSEELHLQQKETAQLRLQIKLLSDKLQMAENTQTDAADNAFEPPPPHY
jgi:uncharacterized coiled-coil protein SlyX